MTIIGETTIRIKTVFGDRDIPAHLTSENEVIPKTTYKYLDIESCFTRCSLENQYAYFSNPKDFNDPFDRVIPIAYHLLDEDDKIFIDYFTAKAKRIDLSASSLQISLQVLVLLVYCRTSYEIKELFKCMKGNSRELLDNMLPELGVYSTSLLHNNVLLWSHYANKHTGICLGIDTYKLITSLNCGAARIKYGSYPIIIPFDMDDENEVKRNYEPMFLSKGEFWNYEEEYRFLIYDFNNERKQNFGSCIESLILGSEISAVNRRYAITTCKAINPNIEIFEAEKKNFSFELDIFKVNV